MIRAPAARALLGLLVLAGCATPPPPPPPPSAAARVLRDWPSVIRPVDRERLARLPEAWRKSLFQARAAGHASELRALGELVDPDAGVDGAPPSAGYYRCRVVKLGDRSDQGGLSFVAYGWFRCRIERTPNGLKFSKLTGSQRPAGLLFPDTAERMVLLGGLALGAEPPARSYGLDPNRDVVGAVERLSGGGWRIALPWPQAESNLDLIELKAE